MEYMDTHTHTDIIDHSNMQVEKDLVFDELQTYRNFLHKNDTIACLHYSDIFAC